MIGTTLRNRYLVESLLGEGSTATVYRARDQRLGRTVALKVLLPHVRDTVVRRFFQEASSAAQLNHPNIMHLYDVIEEDGLNMLVVEYVEGVPLSELVPSPPQRAAEIARQIALALHYAHEHDIIHRDVKPANIMITPAGQVKIMDLGLALPREAKRVTAAGMIIGTPAYLSPEQAQAQPLDRRTDVYSLGVVLYELVTGNLPFSQDDIPALLLQHVREAPPPPRGFKPDLPPALEAIILKAMEKLPSRRFQTAKAMADALDEIIAPAPGASAAVTESRPASDVSRPVAMVRIVLADDHSMLRRSLANLLNEHPGFIVVGEAADGDQALASALEHQPDIILLDLNMPRRGGLDVLPELRSRIPRMRVLVLTGRDEEFYIMQALKLGAHGYMLKSADETDLISAIQRVAGGNMMLGSGVAEKVISGALRDSPALTDAERRLMLLVAAGFDNEQIADRMQIDLADVIEGLATSMDKLDARDRYAAALTAVRRGFVPLEEMQSIR